MTSMISGTLIQIARIALDWKQDDLAEAAGCHISTVGKIEKNLDVNETTRAAIVKALEDAGIVFVSSGDGLGAGVRWSSLELQEKIVAAKRDREIMNLDKRKKRQPNDRAG